MGENNISENNMVDKKTTTITDAGKTWNVHLTYLSEPISKSIGGTESNVIDPWNEKFNAMGSEKILPPPFNQSVMMLAQTRDISPPLSRLIEAMVTNITKFGYEFKPHEWVENPESSEVQKEKDSISKLFQYPNSDIQSFIELRSAIEQDYEEVGYAGMEIVENSKNEIAELYYLPAPTFRLTIRDTIFTPFQQNILAGKGDIEIIDRKKDSGALSRLMKRCKRYSSGNGEIPVMWTIKPVISVVTRRGLNRPTRLLCLNNNGLGHPMAYHAIILHCWTSLGLLRRPTSIIFSLTIKLSRQL